MSTGRARVVETSGAGDASSPSMPATRLSALARVSSMFLDHIPRQQPVTTSAHPVSVPSSSTAPRTGAPLADSRAASPSSPLVLSRRSMSSRPQSMPSLSRRSATPSPRVSGKRAAATPATAAAAAAAAGVSSSPALSSSIATASLTARVGTLSPALRQADGAKRFKLDTTGVVTDAGAGVSGPRPALDALPSPSASASPTSMVFKLEQPSPVAATPTSPGSSSPASSVPSPPAAQTSLLIPNGVTAGRHDVQLSSVYSPQAKTIRIRQNRFSRAAHCVVYGLGARVIARVVANPSLLRIQAMYMDLNAGANLIADQIVPPWVRCQSSATPPPAPFTFQPGSVTCFGSDCLYFTIYLHSEVIRPPGKSPSAAAQWAHYGWGGHTRRRVFYFRVSEVDANAEAEPDGSVVDTTLPGSPANAAASLSPRYVDIGPIVLSSSFEAIIKVPAPRPTSCHSISSLDVAMPGDTRAAKAPTPAASAFPTTTACSAPTTKAASEQVPGSAKAVMPAKQDCDSAGAAAAAAAAPLVDDDASPMNAKASSSTLTDGAAAAADAAADGRTNPRGSNETMPMSIPAPIHSSVLPRSDDVAFPVSI